MLIPHPLLGPRDAAEFTVIGDASLINRPPAMASESDMHDWAYLRDNPAGEHRELWYHEHGDRSWLVVTRDTVTHDVIQVELARDVARRQGRSQ